MQDIESILALPNLDAVIEKALAERSLAEFIKQAWHVLEPAQEYKHGWHIDAICQHLEAITSGDINRLLINVPPGTMKSLISGVFWPAWEWGPRGLPSTRILGASHSQNYAMRDAVKMRRLIESPWYQSRWPVFLARDQNAKTKFENTSTGFREAASSTSMTGARGDRVIWDDPHSVEGAISDADRMTAVRVFHETLPTRLNNPDSSAIVIVMQRLHEYDVSGAAMEEDHGYVHLCLPMEFEPDRKCITKIGFEDPRTEDGELLFPERFPQVVVDRDKKIMGPVAVAGQFQQRPVPRGGGLFKVEGFKIMGAAPAVLNKIVRYWDKAGTDGGGAYTAGVKMAEMENGQFIILDVVRGQWSPLKREERIRQTAEMDGVKCHQWVEQEPGSGGKESAENTIRKLAGFKASAERVTGDKETRAGPYAAQVEACNIFLLKADWNKEFLHEHEMFPGKYKDQVDAAAGAFNKLAPPKKRVGTW